MTITIKIQKVTVPALENLTLEGVELQIENPLAALTDGGIFGNIESLVEAIIEDAEKEEKAPGFANEPEIDVDFPHDIPEGFRKFLESQKAAQESVKKESSKATIPFPFAGNIQHGFNALDGLNVPTPEQVQEALEGIGGLPIGKLASFGNIGKPGNKSFGEMLAEAVEQSTKASNEGGGIGIPGLEGLQRCVMVGPNGKPQEIKPEDAFKMISELKALGAVPHITAIKKGNK